MNIHFHIAGHHVRAAIRHAYLGVRDEATPLETRVREALGQEPEPEPTRRERLESEARSVEERARGQVKGAVGRVRRTA
ncbi:MAG: hypothetical protein ABEJ74_02125 [Haloferacaceae archaeon]